MFVDSGRNLKPYEPLGLAPPELHAAVHQMRLESDLLVLDTFYD